MKDTKIKAIIVPMDDNAYDIYFQDYIENKDIIIDGGHDNASYNNELLNDIKKTLEDYQCYGLGYSGFDTTKEFLNYYLPKENKKSWSGKQIKDFQQLSSLFINCNSYQEDDLCLDILYIITGIKYKCITIYGYHESAHLLLEESISMDARLIRDIKALYFGYAYELFFTSNDIESPEDIYEDYDKTWTSTYNVEEIKKEIAGWYEDTKPEDITLYQAQERHVVKYDYVEV